MSSQLPEILASIRTLEPLPHVALRVLELSQRADVVPRDLIGVIQTEPALTAKVLRLTNSAYYGFKRQIASLDEAGNLLGTSTLVNLVLTGCTARYFQSTSTASAAVRTQRWERAVAQALAASLLARVTQGTDRNRAYTAGLLQDIGELVLERFADAQRARIEHAVAQGMPRLAAEAETLGLSHAEVGARLAQRWNFPEILVDAIRNHHTPERATVDGMLVNVVHLAAHVVEELERERSGDTRPGYASDETALAHLGLDALALAGLHDALTRELEKAREFVDA